MDETATKAKLADVKAELATKTDVSELKTDIVRPETRLDETATKAELADVKAELANQDRRLRTQDGHCQTGDPLGRDRDQGQTGRRQSRTGQP